MFKKLYPIRGTTQDELIQQHPYWTMPLLVGNIALISMAIITNAIAKPHHQTRDPVFDDSLQVLGVLTGINANRSSSGYEAWIGTDGDYTSEFINTSGESITLIIWGSGSSYVNTEAPLITHSLNNEDSLDISFAENGSGAWAAIYSDTILVNGQVFETWGEYTFDGQYSTLDVSREVNMHGRDMSIETEGCTSDMNTCVFRCTDDVASCWQNYELANCAAGSQGGASYGSYAGSASGGCNLGSSKHFQTTVS